MLGAAGLERAEGGGVSLLTMLRNMSGTLQLVEDHARPGHVLLWRADSPTPNPVPGPNTPNANAAATPSAADAAARAASPAAASYARRLAR